MTNAIVIVTDDQRADQLDYMPATRTLGGVARVFPQSRMDVAKCQPGRMSLQTGQRAQHHGVYTNQTLGALDLDNMLPKWADDDGYRVGLIGKWTNSENANEAVHAGFTTFLKAKQSVPGTDEYNFGLWDGTTASTVAEYQTEWMLDEATTFLAGAEPWLLFLTPTLPHGGYRPHLDDLHAWAWQRFEIVDDPNIADKAAWVQALPALSLAERTNIVRQYRATLREQNMVDRMIAGLLQIIDLSDTLLFVTSDGGVSCGEHNRVFGRKDVYYDYALRQPILAAGPGITAGVSPEPVCIQDITATICAALSITPGLTLDGVDLRDVQNNPGTYTNRALLHQGRSDSSPDSIPDWDAITMPIAGATYKYARIGAGPDLEMYDLTNDPDELVNLTLDAGYADEEATLDAELDALLAA